MGWRVIPIGAALCAMSLGRIVHDSIIQTATAAEAIAQDDGNDLSHVDFSSWLRPTSQPTSQPSDTSVPTHSVQEVATIEDSSSSASKDMLVWFRKFKVETIHWPTQAAPQSSQPISSAFGSPAIDVSVASTPAGAWSDSSFSGSSGSRAKSIDDVGPIALPPLSDTVTSVNDPALSIAGHGSRVDSPTQSPLPTPAPIIISLPPTRTPTSVPEPGAMLQLICGLWIGRRRRAANQQ